MAALTPRTPAEVARAFLTPRRLERAAVPNVISGPANTTRSFTANGPIGIVAGCLLGGSAQAEPDVLLLHGWEGAPTDFSGFLPPLLAAGRRLLALDLPGHGASEGEQVSIPLAAQALLDVQRTLGPAHVFHAGIAHSLGAAILVHAMTLGFRIGRVALIAAPANAVDYARDYCERDGLDAAQTEHMLDLLQSRFGVDVRAISMPSEAATLSQPALFVHADDDRVVPIASSRQSAGAWCGAEHVTVAGLGHARLLRDAHVIDMVARFVAA